MIRVIKESSDTEKVDELTIKKMKDTCDDMWSDDKVVIVKDGEYFNVNEVKVDRDNGYVYLFI